MATGSAFVGASLVRILHIEPSTRCTISCMHCPRTMYPSHLAIEDIDIDTVVRACRGIEILVMCGNHGDPIYHADLHGLVRRVRAAHPDIRVCVITNGSHRTVQWWEEFARLLADGDEVVFSIDGMPWNNHIYRVNSRWATIERAVQTLRTTNPRIALTWKWILFNYNQDQVTDGIELARSMGFRHFKVIESTRLEDVDPLRASRGINQVREELGASGISTM